MTLHTFTKALLVATIAIFLINAINILIGYYPWGAKFSSNDHRLYLISSKLLWAIIFALAAERSCLFKFARKTNSIITIFLILLNIVSMIEAFVKLRELAVI